MTIIPPPNVLHILIRNKLAEGMSPRSVAALIRHRLRWWDIEPDALDDFRRERYKLAKQIIEMLEQDPSQ